MSAFNSFDLNLKPCSRKGIPLIALAAILAAAACDNGDSYRPLPLETPGVIYRPSPGLELPHPAVGWQYQVSHMILYSQGSWEWIGTDPAVALYDWCNDEVEALSIPDLSSPHMYSFAQSPYENLIAYSGPDDIFLFDLSAGEVQKWTRGVDPTFSPDGTRIAFWRDGQLIAKSVGALEEAMLFEIKQKFAQGVTSYEYAWYAAWSPAGTAIAFRLGFDERQDGSTHEVSDKLVVLDLTSRELTTIDSFDRNQFSPLPSWSPDGRLLLYIKQPLFGGLTKLLIADWQNECEVRRLWLHDVDHAFWSPAGDVIAVTNGGGRYLYFIDVVKAFGSSYDGLGCAQ